MDPLDKLIEGIRHETELPYKKCGSYDYGKTAPVEYGAYCHSKKQFVEPEDCEACEVVVSKTEIATEKHF